MNKHSTMNEMGYLIRTVSDTTVDTVPDKEKRLVKVYEKPELIFYGDVRDVTLGPTFGGGESGCEGIRRVGPGGCP